MKKSRNPVERASSAITRITHLKNRKVPDFLLPNYLLFPPPPLLLESNQPNKKEFKQVDEQIVQVVGQVQSWLEQMTRHGVGR